MRTLLTCGSFLAAALLVSGCTGNLLSLQERVADRYAEAAEERQQLGEVTRADLEEALRSANAHGDEVAAVCWQSMLNVLNAAGEDRLFTEPKGVFSTFQKVRNTRRILSDDVSTQIKIGCAALKEETTGRFTSIFRLASPL